MEISGDRTVGDLAVNIPNAARVFEMFGIDSCCGGDSPLAEAAPRAGLPTDEAIALLSGDWTVARPAEGALRWTLASLADLIDEIGRGHHRYMRSRLVYFDRALRVLTSGHGRTHAHLTQVRATLDRLVEILVPHMRNEEQVVFPYMCCLERLIDPQQHSTRGATPSPSFRLEAMSHEHADDLSLLDELRRVTGDYAPLADACENERTLYRELAELDVDFRQHIHLENDVLFRRAAEMEWIAQTRAG